MLHTESPGQPQAPITITVPSLEPCRSELCSSLALI